MTEDPFAPQPAAQRREARERAIELLYEAELRAAPAAEILEDQLVALDPFVIELVLGVTSNVEELDAEIGSLTEKGMVTRPAWHARPLDSSPWSP